MKLARIALLPAALMLVAGLAPSARPAEMAGSLSVDYRYRSAPGKAGFPSNSDQDLDLWGRADVTNLSAGRVDGHLTLRGFQDLDDSDLGNPLFGIGDTYSNRNAAFLYEGFLQFRLPGGPASLSLGRRYVPVGTGLTQAFDGAQADAALLGGKVRATLFGGARVSHFIDPQRDGIFGGKASVTPWKGALIELSDVKYTFHCWEIAAAHRVPLDGRVAARFSSIDDDPESFRLDGHVHLPLGIAATLDYLRKIGSGPDRKAFPFDFTSLDDAAAARLRLGVLKPYARYAAAFRVPLGGKVGIGVEGARRKLIHDADEDAFNFSTWEAGATAEVRDFPVAGLAAWARYRRLWEDRELTPQGDSQVGSAGLSYQATRRLSAGAELFANAQVATVAEPIIPAGFATIDRSERGGAVWARWSDRRLSGEVRYERADDDLYDFYGVKALNAVSATVALSL